MSICTTLASLGALKVLDEEGMAGPIEASSTRWHNSLSSVAATVAVANSMLFYSQSSARWVLVSTVMTLVGSGTLSLR
jgi:hypothetical protein